MPLTMVTGTRGWLRDLGPCRGFAGGPQRCLKEVDLGTKMSRDVNNS